VSDILAVRRFMEGRTEIPVFAANVMVDMYAKKGAMESEDADAGVQRFQEMESHDVVSWSAVI
jgi:hypothetical protein